MMSFLRIIRTALRYPFTVGATVVCSILVGMLWGANIGTVYPILSVVFHGESIAESFDRDISESKEKLTELQEQVKQLDLQTAGIADKDKHNHARKLSNLHAQTRNLAADIERKEILLPWIKQWLPEDPMATMGIIVSVLLGLTLLRSLLMAFHSIFISKLTHLTVYHLQKRLYHKNLKMDLAVIEKDRTSNLMSHFTHDVRKLGDGMQDVFGPLLREPFKIIACLVGAAAVSWRLLLISLMIAPVAGLFVKMYSLSARKHSHNNMNAMSKLYSRLLESFSGLRVIQAFTMERAERRRFHKASKGILIDILRLARLHAFIKPISEVLAFLMVAVALMVGTHLVVNQATHIWFVSIAPTPLSPEALMLFFGFMIGMTDPIHRLSGISVRLSKGAAAAERYFGYLNREPKIKDPDDPVTLQSTCGDITFNNVHFHYQEGTPVLKGIDLHISEGECVALVGANGCGKSTLTDMIMRFYDPTEGNISLGSTDLRDLRLKDLRKHIGLVTQTTKLFDDTIRNNIREARPDATDEEVEVAAWRAEAHQFILDNLPEGYDTVVGEGATFLSGGQAQRIAVARAILRDPSILILDEPTSNIDVGGEQAIIRSLKSFIRGRTTILVTHRLELLELADRILVLEGGRISASGSLEELALHNQTIQKICRLEIRRAA